MFFKYGPGGEIEGFRPRSVFARVDSVEPGVPADEEPPTVYLDCIDASWLTEEAAQRAPLWRVEDTEADWRISVIEISGSHLGLKPDEEAEGRWWHLQLEDSPTGTPVLQYFNLFADPVERVMTGRRDLTRSGAPTVS
jgi:hypothetical protein